MDGDRVAGAVVLDLRDSMVFTVRAKSVILATGGYQAMYAFNDCEPGATGDGLAMAMHIGATLVDLEMILYYPTCLTWPEEVAGTLVQYEGLLGPRYLGGRSRPSSEKRITSHSLPWSSLRAFIILCASITDCFSKFCKSSLTATSRPYSASTLPI